MASPSSSRIAFRNCVSQMLTSTATACEVIHSEGDGTYHFQHDTLITRLRKPPEGTQTLVLLPHLSFQRLHRNTPPYGREQLPEAVHTHGRSPETNRTGLSLGGAGIAHDECSAPSTGRNRACPRGPPSRPSRFSPILALDKLPTPLRIIFLVHAAQECEDFEVGEVLRCLLHTILFHRAVGHLTPTTVRIHRF